MDFPNDLRFTKEHEWIRLENGGRTATIGITDFAQGELGDVVYVELQNVGTDLARDDAFGTVEAVKTVSELFMPVSGRIVEINQELEAHPEQVNEDPYGKGWMIKIELSDAGEIDALLTAEQYKEMVG